MQVYEHFEDVDAFEVAAEDLGPLEFRMSEDLHSGGPPARTYGQVRENSGGYDPRTELGISSRSRSLGKRIIELRAQSERARDLPDKH